MPPAWVSTVTLDSFAVSVSVSVPPESVSVPLLWTLRIESVPAEWTTAKPESMQKPRQCRITTGDLIGAGDADRVDRGGGGDSCEKIAGEIKKSHVAEAFNAFRGCIWRGRGLGGIAGQTR